MARRRKPEAYLEADDVEYVDCPVCGGVGRNCRYCDGYGDVHPDDMELILAAQSSDRTKQMILVGVGAFLFTGLLVGIFLFVRAQRVEGGGGGDGGMAGGFVEGGAGDAQKPPKKKDVLPPGYSKEVKAIIIEARMDLKVKLYDAAIQKATEALPRAQEDVQRKNLEDIITEAKRLKGG